MAASYDAYYDFDQTGLPDNFLLREAHEELATSPDRHEIDLVMRVRTAQLLDKHLPERNISIMVMSLIAPNNVTDEDVKHTAFEFGEEPARYMKQLGIISKMPEELLPIAPEELKAYYLAFQMSALSVIWDASQDQEQDILELLTRQLRSTCTLTKDMKNTSLRDEAITLVERMEKILENPAANAPKDTPSQKPNPKGPKPPKM